jgi:DNA-binding GntR family transcriptional regulator
MELRDDTVTLPNPFGALLADIVTGRLKAGDRVKERSLVPRLGVSRTPVREAIRKLEGLGLIECLPRKGAVVAELSPTDVEALYFVRFQLERLVSRLAFGNLSPADAENLRELNRDLRACYKAGGGLFDLIQKDRQFHGAIYRASGNRFLTEVIDDLQLRCYVIAYYAWRNPDQVRTSIEEHGEMIKALKQGDRRRFEALMEHQLVAAKAAYLEGCE